ncbi:hypothetical protein HY792_06175 [Candidatus Desantisbacteria bacterium]|nr:hypothetical protein [Candidatus Desantisbacteria bacterium]
MDETCPVTVVDEPSRLVETVSLSSNPQFIALIEHSRKHQVEYGSISSQEMRKRLEKIETNSL